MAKRKRHNNKPNTFEENVVMLIPIFLFVATFVGSALVAGVYSFLSSEGFFQIYRYVVIGTAVPVVFMIGYRLKTGRWPEG